VFDRASLTGVVWPVKMMCQVSLRAEGFRPEGTRLWHQRKAGRLLGDVGSTPTRSTMSEHNCYWRDLDEISRTKRVCGVCLAVWLCEDPWTGSRGMWVRRGEPDGN
jgi:hypothetical protein